MPLAQAQTADKDELSHSFLLAMRESFNDNTSDNMYKHIRLDLLSFSLESPRWHRTDAYFIFSRNIFTEWNSRQNNLT